MLFFHDIAAIKDAPMVVITPATAATPAQTTLDAIKSDIWDYHFDHKRWWQQANNKSPIPVTPPRYGKAYPRIHYKIVKRVPRQLTTSYEASITASGFNDLIVPHPGAVIVSPVQPDSPPCDTDGIIFVDAPLTTDRGITTSLSPIDGGSPVVPPPGSHTVYWRTNRGIGHFDCGSGNLIVVTPPTLRYGNFQVPDDVYNTPNPQILTTLHDEFISDHKVARLNYLSFLDAKILRKGIGAAPDPIPVTEALWRGVWNDVDRYEIMEIVSDENRTYFCIRAGTDKKPGTSPTWWERCNRPKTQIVAGVGVCNNPVTISQFRTTFGATGAQTYLFLNRTDIKPTCVRPFNAGDTQRDWRTFGDTFGIAVDGVSGFGNEPFLSTDPNFKNGAQILFLSALGTVERWNGKQHIIVSQSTAVADSDDSAVDFLIRTNIFQVTEFVTVQITEEPAP